MSTDPRELQIPDIEELYRTYREYHKALAEYAVSMRKAYLYPSRLNKMEELEKLKAVGMTKMEYQASGGRLTMSG